MRTFILLSSSLLVMAGCSKNEPQTKMPLATSFTSAEGEDWTGTYTTKKSENAHTGRTVAFIDGVNVYSMGYLKSIENISKSKLDSVTYSYWTYCTSNAVKAQTVLSIDAPDNSKNVFWTSKPFEAKVKEYNKWVFVSETFKLPPNMDPKYILKMYVWNNSKEEILLDDFKVDFY